MVQLIVPILLNVPAVYVAVLEQVKLNVAKFIAPEVIVNEVQFIDPDKVVVPAPLSIVNGPTTVLLAFGVMVPVPTIVTDMDEIDEAALVLIIKLLTFTELPLTAGTLTPVVPKSSLLNQLPAVNLASLVVVPPDMVKFGALDGEPPEVEPTA